MQDMPRFIETLYSIVSSEQEERCRAVRDTGNYRLAERYAHHKTDISYWASMSEENRHKRMNRFLSDLGKESNLTVVSTDGSRTNQRTPSAGRKPQQFKRKRAERSRTPNAKRRLTNTISVGKGSLLTLPGVLHADMNNSVVNQC